MMQMTPAEREAERQAKAFLQTYDPLLIQRGMQSSGRRSAGGMCMADGSLVSFDVLEGDFAVDEPVVAALLRGALDARPKISAPPGPPRKAAVPTQPSAASTSKDVVGTATPEWLEQWKAATGSNAAAGTVDRMWEELVGAVASPGNVLGNVAGVSETVARFKKEALIKSQVERLAAEMMDRGAKGVAINPNVRIYDANAVKAKKLRAAGQKVPASLSKPRLRIQLTGINTKVIDLGGLAASVTRAGARGGVGITPGNSHRVAMVATDQWVHQSKSLRFFTSTGFGATLAFAPSMIVDALDSYETLADGSGAWNGQKFLKNTTKSLPANAVGFGAGLVARGLAPGLAVAVLGVTVGTGGLVLIALGAGFFVQWAFNSSGAADWTARQLEKAL